MNRINGPSDLKKLKTGQLGQLACELRDKIIEAVSTNGGHLASNLGVVELTIAIHKIFDSPKDRIIFDVGHQSYAHKLLTGRLDKFDTLRHFGGISGYPNPDESPHDQYHTGHASTAISLGAAEVVAKRLSGGDHKIVVVVGDGSLTGGESFEALNHLGQLNEDILVVLNDNQMSISPSVGAVSLLTSKFRAALFYRMVSRSTGKIMSRMGSFGNWALGTGMKMKAALKRILMADQYFEQLGFKYLGPVDGHDIPLLLAFLGRIKHIKGPVLLHVATKKGKGCSFAESMPTQFHGTPPFEKANGETKPNGRSFSGVFGETLLDLAKKDPKIIAITAAMSDGTGLAKMQKELPRQFIDVGIAEPHAVTLAAGLAKNGFRPVVAIYSTFLQRAYDQIIHDVALMGLPVMFAIDRAGLVPDDGPTHQGIFDIAYLSTIPELTLMAPSTAKELQEMLAIGLSLPGPVAIRYPKDLASKEASAPVELGKATLERSGDDVLLAYFGGLRGEAHKTAQLLVQKNIGCSVLNLRFGMPIDFETISEHSNGKKIVVTIEDGILQGGIGQKIKNLIGENIFNFGVSSEFPPIGTREQLLARYGLDHKSIGDFILSKLDKA